MRWQKNMMASRTQYEELQKIYSEIPMIPCETCGSCCGPAPASRLERKIISAYIHGHKIPPGDYFTPYVQTPSPKGVPREYRCSFLSESNQCKIYPVRPLICRFFGVTGDMKCPNGNRPERYLSEKEIKQLLKRRDRLEYTGVSDVW